MPFSKYLKIIIDFISLYFILYEQMVEFKNDLRQHLKRGETVVGNNYVRVMKSPNTYDSSETWCDGSVSVRLIVTSFPRFFFIDLPSDKIPGSEKRETNCCVPAFEFSDGSFFGAFFTGSNDVADTQENTLDFRKKNVQKISKEQRTWDSSSHPQVVEVSIDSIEVAFLGGLQRYSPTPPTPTRRIGDGNDRIIKQNTYVFIDEINGSKYWCGIFNELKHTKLLSGDSETHTIIIEKETKIKTPKTGDKDYEGKNILLSDVHNDNINGMIHESLATRLFTDEDSIEVYSNSDKMSISMSQPVSLRREEINAALNAENAPKLNVGELPPGGKIETKIGTSIIDLNIRQKVPSRASMRVLESTSIQKIDKDLFLKNWDDESYRLVSSGLGASNSINNNLNNNSNNNTNQNNVISNRKSMNYSSIKEREKGNDNNCDVRKSLPSSKSGKSELDAFIKNWDSENYKMCGSGLVLETDSRASSRAMSPSDTPLHGQQSLIQSQTQLLNPMSEKRKNSRINSNTNQMLDDKNELGSLTKGEVFVRNFDHDAYKRCGSGMYDGDSGTTSPIPSGTPPRPPRADDILRLTATGDGDIKKRSNNSPFRIDQSSPQSSSPTPMSVSTSAPLSPAPVQYPNNFSPKVLFGSQIVKLRKVLPKTDDDVDVSTSNNGSMYALKGNRRRSSRKKNKEGMHVCLCMRGWVSAHVCVCMYLRVCVFVFV